MNIEEAWPWNSSPQTLEKINVYSLYIKKVKKWITYNNKSVGWDTK